MASKLLLIRHAYTGDANRGKMVGSTDVPADDQGLATVTRLRGVIKEYQPDGWFCSPMLRTRQTAERIFGKDLSHKVVFDERLQEINFGRWEKLTYEEISRNDPEMVASWAQYTDFVFPEGESVAAFASRVDEMWNRLRQHEAHTVVVVTHGGIIRKMICLALGLPIKNYLLFNVEPAKMAVLDVYPEGALLSGLNI